MYQQKEQLSFFDVAAPPRVKVKKRIKPKKLFRAFNFDDTCNKIKDLLNSQANSFARKNINAIHEAGKLLLEMRIHKPKMQFKKSIEGIMVLTDFVSFWDYTERLFNLSPHTVFEYMRTYEIRNLLLENGFKNVPDTISLIKEIWDYTDNQIMEIWSEIEPGLKLNFQVIRDARNNIREKDGYYLETPETVNTHTDYYRFLSSLYLSELNQNRNLNKQIVEKNTVEYEVLEKKFNSLVTDYKNLKIKLERVERDYDILLSEKNPWFNKKKGLNDVPSRKNECLELLCIKSINPTITEINKAFKEQAFILHPDHNSNLNDYQIKVFEKEFNKIKQAKDFLISILK